MTPFFNPVFIFYLLFGPTIKYVNLQITSKINRTFYSYTTDGDESILQKKCSIYDLKTKIHQIMLHFKTI